MSAAGNTLTRKQDAAVLALLTAKTNALAAAEAGVSEATLQRWLLLPEFQQAYRAARRTLVEGAIAALQRATSDAVLTLQGNLKAARPSDQNSAAALILKHAIGGVELVDLMSRVNELESLMQEIIGRGKPG